MVAAQLGNQQQSSVSDSDSSDKGRNNTSSGFISSKETESSLVVQQESIKELSEEIEIPEEVEKAGVKKIAESVKIPPDIKKLGVSPAGSSPPAKVVRTQSVALPISDEKVITGLHAQVTDAIKWLALWCIKRLRKAHIILKKIHGKIVRVSE